MQSLYPYVCKWKKYPTGNPVVIYGDDLNRYTNSIESFEGLVKCKILPPRSLYTPLLPSHIGGKLIFTLCRSCAEHKNVNSCSHNEEERALLGVWVTEELKKANTIGYKILNLYEVWHYKTTSTYNKATDEKGLFGSYMDTFMKRKIEASGKIYL